MWEIKIEWLDGYFWLSSSQNDSKEVMSSERKRKNFNCEKTREKAFQVESLNTSVLRQGIHLIYMRRTSVGSYR